VQISPDFVSKTQIPGACPLILLAGLLLFCQLYLFKSLNEKITYIENLSLEFWALLDVFKMFFNCVVDIHVEDMFPDILPESPPPEPRNNNHGDIFDVACFVPEVIIFSSRQVLQDCL